MSLETARPDAEDPLLIYSLAEFRELIFAAFDAAGVRTVVEIGNEQGTFTRYLLDWLGTHDGSIVSIDPAPGPDVRSIAAGSDRIRLVLSTSHAALADLEAMDAYLVDGDHNYYTVAGELDLIAAAADKASHSPLIFVQDIGWPTGRRDMYYDPGSIPAEAVHPHSNAGSVPWSDDLVVTGGFRGNGEFAYAEHEGGPRNGVWTAVEDFLSARPGYKKITIPCIFGLAVLYPAGAEWAEALERALAHYDEEPMLARMEANRLRLYIEVLALNDSLEKERRRAATAESRLGQEVDELRLRAAVAEQLARQAALEKQQLQGEIQALQAQPAAVNGSPPAGRPGLGRLAGWLRR